MHKTFEALQRLRVAQHPRSKALAVDLARDHDAWKRRLDRFRPLAGVEVANGVVGVECRDAKLGEHAATVDFPIAIEPVSPTTITAPPRCVAATSASTSARNAGVTTGRLPNQRANAGAAWWSSMPRPSDGAQSARARAASMSGVRNGT